MSTIEMNELMSVEDSAQDEMLSDVGLMDEFSDFGMRSNHMLAEDVSGFSFDY